MPDLDQHLLRTSLTPAAAAAQLDRIFDHYIPHWARRSPDPIRFVLYAPAGLYSEAATLAQIRTQIGWWKSNGIYPVYLLGQTGLLDSIAGLLARARRRALAVTWDGALDLMTERLLRSSAVPFWAQCKAAAEASQVNGLSLLSSKLGSLCNTREAAVHVVAHSAGSLLAANLVSAALNAGLGSFRTLQLLAPALRLDAFDRMIAPHLGVRIGHSTVYALTKRAERADPISRLYHKSLLYLISHALEPEYNAALVGLEESLRGSVRTAAQFGLAGAPNPNSEVLWNETATHSGIEDAPAVMNEVMRRILNGCYPLNCPYQQQNRNGDDDAETEQQQYEEGPVAA